MSATSHSLSGICATREVSHIGGKVSWGSILHESHVCVFVWSMKQAAINQEAFTPERQGTVRLLNDLAMDNGQPFDYQRYMAIH
ncbi:hypothetical protein NPIL_490761 [Nephila pilipes]|uniref:Uncharacterized protein n=1 Tax=Nephila pilipes TaxID=299642 RepID=A0A8X6Q203_NEPPI|nr:hypothetical protein NPIL_490761 [Nephila pilipes]